MPRITGFEVLSWLASRPDLVDVPAVILSSSSYEEDIQRARQLGARDYFVKPHSLKDLVTILQQMALRWLPLPERQRPSHKSRLN
jgi:CheY-like chemotaxis protein